MQSLHPVSAGWSQYLQVITLDPINAGEFYLRSRNGKGSLTTPSTCFVTRLLVMLCLSLAGVVNGKLVELACSLRGFEMSLSLWWFIPSGSRIWTHSFWDLTGRNWLRGEREDWEEREDWQGSVKSQKLCVTLWQFSRALFVKQGCNYQSTRDACVSSIVSATLSNKSLHVGCVHVATTRNEWR